MNMQHFVELELAGETGVLEKTFPVPVRPLEIARDMTWDWTLAASAGSRLLTAWPMTRGQLSTVTGELGFDSQQDQFSLLNMFAISAHLWIILHCYNGYTYMVSQKWKWGSPNLLSNVYWGHFPLGWSDQCMKLTTRLQLVRRPREQWPINPLPMRLHGVVLNYNLTFIQGVLKRASQLQKLVQINSEDMYSVLNLII
jgi:hypothetical protein